jgi:hypothetical protein
MGSGLGTWNCAAEARAGDSGWFACPTTSLSFKRPLKPKIFFAFGLYPSLALCLMLVPLGGKVEGGRLQEHHLTAAVIVELGGEADFPKPWANLGG